MKKKSFYLVLMLAMTSAASVNAQVLIGGSETDDPHAGSILDLSPGGSMNLGLLLPKVELVDDANEFALESDDASAPATAKGMIVYNTANVLDGRGLYVWDGSKWTSLGITCLRSFIDERDGNKYFAGDFGAAGCWMTQHLRYIPDANDGYSEIDANATNGEKYYTYPGIPGSDADARREAWEEHKDYGLLYNWYAATGRPDSDTDEGNTDHGPHQGICPTGWHIPSDKEWSDLEQVIAADTWQESFRTAIGSERTTTTHGLEMISRRNVTNDDSGGTSNPADDGGFDALLVGSGINTATGRYGTSAFFWTGSAGETGSYFRRLDKNRKMVARDKPAVRMNNLHSVRCKKD
jgi:uncharacterized protein (TIGR02145 family)